MYLMFHCMTEQSAATLTYARPFNTMIDVLCHLIILQTLSIKGLYNVIQQMNPNYTTVRSALTPYKNI